MTVTTSDRDAATKRAEAAAPGPLIEGEALQTFFTTRHGVVKAVDGMSFALAPGETLAIVGESGCGKSITALSLMRVGGAGRLAGVDLIGLDEEAMRAVRGKDIAMIFQEPMSSLNPVLTIGSQIAEAVLLHEPLTRAQRRRRAPRAGVAAGAAPPRPGLAEGGRHATSGAHLRAGRASRGLS